MADGWAVAPPGSVFIPDDPDPDRAVTLIEAPPDYVPNRYVQLVPTKGSTVPKTTTYTPVNDLLLVKPLDAPEKTEGGILLPDSSREKPAKGLVLAVGPGKVRDNGAVVPVAIKPGQMVLYKRWAGENIHTGIPGNRGEQQLLIHEGEVLATYEEVEA